MKMGTGISIGEGWQGAASPHSWAEVCYIQEIFLKEQYEIWATFLISHFVFGQKWYCPDKFLVLLHLWAQVPIYAFKLTLLKYMSLICIFYYHIVCNIIHVFLSLCPFAPGTKKESFCQEMCCIGHNFVFLCWS